MEGLASLDKKASINTSDILSGKSIRNAGKAGDIFLRAIEHPVGGAIAVAAALKGISAATNYFNEKADKNKFNEVISYAKKKHPELRDVPHEKLMSQMSAFYTLAPKAATNKELGSSMLVTTNDYGGNVDLATAKLISDIGSKSENIGNKTDEVLGFITTGKSLSKGK